MPPMLDPSIAMPTFFAAKTPPQWRDFVTRRPRALAEDPQAVVIRQEHIDRLRDLAITGRRAYGRDPVGNDHWDDAPPFVDGQQAVGFDCENLALWARRCMAEEFDDWPLSCSLPTICKLPDGQDHCVLTVIVEDLGDYIVGAQHSENLVPWKSLEAYEWRSRLQSGSRWVTIAAEATN